MTDKNDEEVNLILAVKGRTMRASISREAIVSGEANDINMLTEMVSALLQQVSVEATQNEASSLNILTPYDDGFGDSTPEQLQKYSDIVAKNVVSFDDVTITGTGITDIELQGIREAINA